MSLFTFPDIVIIKPGPNPQKSNNPEVLPTKYFLLAKPTTATTTTTTTTTTQDSSSAKINAIWSQKTIELNKLRLNIEDGRGGCEIEDQIDQYNVYLQKLYEFKHFCREHTPSGLESTSVKISPNWRDFTWRNVTHRSLKYEISATTFNYACCRYAVFKRWASSKTNDLLQLDLRSMEKRLEMVFSISPHPKRDINDAIDSLECDDDFYPQVLPEADKQNISKFIRELKEIAGLFEMLYEEGFPSTRVGESSNRAWDEGFVGIFDASKCIGYHKCCLMHAMLLSHVGTAHALTFPPSVKRSVANWKKSAYLFSHLCVIEKIFASWVSGKSLSPFSPMNIFDQKWNSKLQIALVIYHTKLLHDASRKEGKTLTSVGVLLSNYTAMKTYCISANLYVNSTFSEIWKHLDHCTALLHTYNTALGHEHSPVRTIRDILILDIPNCAKELTTQGIEVTRERCEPKAIPPSWLLQPIADDKIKTMASTTDGSRGEQTTHELNEEMQNIVFLMARRYMQSCDESQNETWDSIFSQTARLKEIEKEERICLLKNFLCSLNRYQ